VAVAHGGGDKRGHGARRAIAAAAVAVAGLAPAAHAQAPAATPRPAAAATDPAPGFPSRPIRIINPFSGGGGLELTARQVGQKLTERWAQPVIVDNRPGAATIVGTEIASKAAPDGHTLLMITTTFAINPSLYGKLPYDPMRDFTPVIQLTAQPNIVVVNASSPFQSVKDLLAAARARPGELTYASPGAGSAPHLSAELMRSMAKIDLIHVPYKGIPPAVTDLLGGRVTMLFTTALSAAPQLKIGKLRALAVTSARRNAMLPEVPTMAETLPGYDLTALQGIVVRAGTPREIVDKLGRALREIVLMPEVRERLESEGADVIASTPEAFAAHLKREMQTWSRIVKESGAKPE
jgi:tripartite-type tricarboxylate transporter receptor subunit TctC